jgi:hypothetical protein
VLNLIKSLKYDFLCPFYKDFCVVYLKHKVKNILPTSALEINRSKDSIKIKIFSLNKGKIKNDLFIQRF